MAELTPVDLIGELLRREEASKSLLKFCEYVMPGWLTAPFHQKLVEKLEAVERREIRRLIINLPPRSGKVPW